MDTRARTCRGVLSRMVNAINHCIIVITDFFVTNSGHLLRAFQNHALGNLDQIPDPFIGRNGELNIQIDRPPFEEYLRHTNHRRTIMEPIHATHQERLQQHLNLVRELMTDRNEILSNWVRRQECGAGDAPALPALFYLLGRHS